MRILIAPDSFKHSLSAKKVAESLARGILKVLPDTEIIIMPLADGGEGTVQALVDATGGRIIHHQVMGPLMQPVDTFFGILADGKTAVIEMAAASGIELLADDELNPSATSTYGTGQLMKKALDLGCEKIIIGIGGSATNDGGTGMAMALGVRFLDAENSEVGQGGGALGEITNIDDANSDKRLKNCEVIIAADVTNLLTGSEGASRIYAPQKGADAREVEILEKNMVHYAQVLSEKYQRDFANIPGAGAAGGLGAGLLAFANAQICAGFEVVKNTLHLEDEIEKADLVITGEGKIDAQTRFGKTPGGVARLAQKYHKPVIAVAGSLGENYQELYSEGFDLILPITDMPMSLADALKNAAVLLEDTGERLARMLIFAKRVHLGL